MLGVSQSEGEDHETGVYISKSSSLSGLGGIIGWSAIFLFIGIIFGITILYVFKRYNFNDCLSKCQSWCCQSNEKGENVHIQLMLSM